MVTKSDFTPEEWQQILTVPQMASIYVALSSPSGPIGLIQEMVASTKLIAEVIKTNSGNTLIDAVAADFQDKVEKRERIEAPEMSRDKEELQAQSLQAVRDVAALLAMKAPTEAEGFKRWVYEAAQHSAQAAKEGGFLGIGGTRVNEAETAALQEIASALGIQV